MHLLKVKDLLYPRMHIDPVAPLPTFEHKPELLYQFAKVAKADILWIIPDLLEEFFGFRAHIISFSLSNVQWAFVSKVFLSPTFQQGESSLGFHFECGTAVRVTPGQTALKDS